MKNSTISASLKTSLIVNNPSISPLTSVITSPSLLISGILIALVVIFTTIFFLRKKK